jgi:hypothetical protein
MGKDYNSGEERELVLNFVGILITFNIIHLKSGKKYKRKI